MTVQHPPALRIFRPTTTRASLRRPSTVNTAHLGIVLKRQQDGLDAGEGIGEIFPFFRAIATDLNLTLAVALWAVIFVQLWGVQTLGLGTNFGRFVGVGSAAVVKGPIGAFVGFLEIISEVARVVSFTFRLFGNILAGEILLFMSAFLVPFLVATVFYGFEVFVGFIQAFVFAMLTLVFRGNGRRPRLNTRNRTKKSWRAAPSGLVIARPGQKRRAAAPEAARGGKHARLCTNHRGHGVY